MCRFPGCLCEEKYILGLCWDHFMELREYLTPDMLVSSIGIEEKQVVIYTGLYLDSDGNLTRKKVV